MRELTNFLQNNNHPNSVSSGDRGTDAESLFDAAKVEETFWQVAPALPMCGYCKDCEWWQENNYNSEIHRCELAESPPNPVNPKSTAIARGEYYSANLETQANHACNQWKAREESEEKQRGEE